MTDTDAILDGLVIPGPSPDPGDQPALTIPGQKSRPVALGGSVAPICGTSRSTWATKLLEFGPGQIR